MRRYVSHGEQALAAAALLAALLLALPAPARAAGPEAAGWYAGDMHAHRSCGGAPETLSAMSQKMSPNNLAAISLLADMGNGEVQNATTDLPLVKVQDDPISTPARIVHWDVEWHWDATYTQFPHQALGGHIVALGVSEAHQIWQEYTKPIFDWAHQAGGIAGFAHLQYLDNNIPQTLNCCGPIEYPVEVALGASDFISEDVVDVNTTFAGMDPEAATRAYYRLLNCGFRPGFAAGTDYPCNVGRDVGGLLTYAQVAGGQMTYRNWIDGIAKGRTVVSRNGHNEFLNLVVNNSATPGDEVGLGVAGSVPVTVTWTANQNLSGTIELVSNGVVVASKQASVTSGTPSTLTVTVPFTKSGWLAARRMGSAGHYVHTAAVFVIVNSAPIRASAADANFYVAWMDNLLQKTSPGGAWNSLFPTSLAAAQARYQAAKVKFQQIALEAGAGNPPPTGGTIWADSAVPNVADSGPDSPVELGVKLRSDVDGFIDGVRFYKSAANSGTHVGNLWSSTGTLLATATFTNETASGWQQVNFAAPVAVTANTVYVASYHASGGHYSDDLGYFAGQGVDSPPLHALADGVSGFDGVFAYGSGSGFPNQGWQSSNYWVDVAFSPAAPPVPLSSIAVAPVNPTLQSGGTVQLTATGTYADGTTQNVTSQAAWTSSSTAVATVGSAGLATAANPGSATISAAVGSISGNTLLTVQSAPFVITTTSLPSATLNLAYSATLSASGGTKPYTWTAAGLPAGLSLNAATGGISGAPTAAGAFPCTVQVTGAAGGSTSKALSITVSAQVNFTIWPNTTVPGVADGGPDSPVELGVKFRSDVGGFINGVRFYKSAANSGTHAGSLWSSTGTLLATATFTNEAASGWQQVNFAAPVAVTANTVYVASYHTSVGHYSVDLGYFAGKGVDSPPLHALADGVSGFDGVFAYGSGSGFPNQGWQSSNYWVDVVFTSTPPATLSSIAVAPANPTILTGTTQQFQATGTYSDGSTKDVSATVTWASSSATVATIGAAGLASGVRGGTASISAMLGVISGSSTLTVVDAPLVISTVSLPDGTRGAAYSSTLRASGGVAPYSWSVTGGLPPGLSSSAAGVLSGTPTSVGTYGLTVQVTDAAAKTTSKTLSLTVNDPPALSIATSSLPGGTRGSTYSGALATSGGVSPYAWVVPAGLPPGLSVSPTTGVISGTPTTVGAYSFTVRVTDAVLQAATKTLSITVLPPSNYTIWPGAVTPSVPDAGPDGAVELGVKFRADVGGSISGVRFYKGAGNTGTHVGNLWSSAGAKLATATFTGETASGWQQVNFAAPVAIAANTVYVASYHTNVGHYSDDLSYFSTGGVDSPPLHALAEGVSGVDGVFAYGSGSSFPNQGWQSSNYWVDVVFTPAAQVASLASIALAPGTPALQGLGVMQFTATGSYSDGSTQDLTRSVSWASSDATVATVDGKGLATAQGYGSTTVSATLDGFTGSTALTVSPPPPPPPEGPGGPILVVSSATNPFSRYYAEILRAEGFNEYTAMDISTVTGATLTDRDVVILGDFALTAAQVAMFTDWVNGGGSLVAMHPDRQLAALLGLTPTGATLGNGYVLVSTVSPPGAGIVGETMQFHGPADLYALSGATQIATVYSTATVASTAPAVTLRSVGAGKAAAFAYDLARSVVYTRQGNPAWSGQERDGTSPIRSDDLFFGSASFDPQPDWVDFTKIQIPHADEQQHLLTNLLLQVNQSRKPLPRFWFLPSGLKAAVVMTGDDHANGGTAGRFDQYIAASPANCVVDDWQCVRGTSYVYASSPITDAQAQEYSSRGFEVALHVTTNCADWGSPADLESFYSTQLATFAANYPSVPASSTNRTHCITWSDYDTQPKVELAHGIRLDTSYYYWPGPWVNDRPGLMTGSGMPMRFADRIGQTIDVYQAATQMTDESDQSYPLHVNTLLDNAIGAKGYYGVFTANMHTDSDSSPGSDAIVASAQARGVPVVSSRQMLTWLDGRNGSSFGSISWSGNVLSFSVSVASGARNLRALLPTQIPGRTLVAITRVGGTVAFTTETIKGVSYAVFGVTTDSYQATYQ